MGKSGLYGRVASTVYLLVTFAAQPQPHHNYPTYSLNRNHAWQEPLATKVAVLKAIFCLRSSMATAPWKDSHSFGHQHGFTLALEDSGVKRKKKKKRRNKDSPRWLEQRASGASDDDKFTAECTCAPNARHTLAHLECHSSHRGLAFRVDSSAPGASARGVKSYPYPNERDCQTNFVYCCCLARIMYLLCDYIVKVGIILYEDTPAFYNLTPYLHTTRFLSFPFWMTCCAHYPPLSHWKHSEFSLTAIKNRGVFPPGVL